jgi:asparagine synthase (glutamine-hydrolysing)
MCGIFGYTDTNNLENYFFKLMKHRGPDAKGIKRVSEWTLGHLRLSIISLGSSSNQPFESDGSNLVYNGEVYNFLELKDKYLYKHKFKTKSDTEVLLTLLNKFGLKILNKLNGMFAFAYLNKNKELFLVRDRFGVKPIYYTQINKKFYFSSEIKPLIALRSNCNLESSTIDSYFEGKGTDFGIKSGYKDIYSIKPGHYISVNNHKMSDQHQWYTGLNNKRNYGNKNELIKECEDILINSIKIRCRADVPVAITLSGGIDSALIYTLIKEKLGLSIQPFIFKHNNKATDESELAISLTKRYGDEPIIVQDPNSPLENLKKVLWHLELPFSHPSAIAFLSTYQEIAKRGYKVVLEGHGSDEQLGGYPYMIHASAIESLQNRKLKDYIKKKKVLLNTYHLGLGQKLNILQLLRSLLSDFKHAYFGKKEDLNKILHESFDNQILPLTLRTFDRLSMSCSLESRMPFMDYKFVEFARRLPTEMRISEIGNKSILRELLKKYGNQEIYLNKQKMGFTSDIPSLFSNHDFKNFIYELVQDFDLKNFQSMKDKATLSNHEKITWKNFSDLWKVASVSYYSNYDKLIKNYL